VFIGHFGVAFAAKRAAPSVSLGTLFLAAQLADLVWPNLVLLGLEKVEVAPGNTAVTPLNFVSYPYSHSLVALVVWAALFAGIHWLIRRRGGVVPWLLGALVLSHWILDAVSHRPDMPIVIGGGPLVGLGLWNSVAATVLVETALFLAGVALYVRATRALDRTGVYALWGLVAFLLFISVANLMGPPPPSAIAVAWVAQSIWLLVFWGYWIDRHRGSRIA
jgi:uncharacterized membrane protein YhaH (DUF805 family)